MQIQVKIIDINVLLHMQTLKIAIYHGKSQSWYSLYFCNFWISLNLQVCAFYLFIFLQEIEKIQSDWLTLFCQEPLTSILFPFAFWGAVMAVPYLIVIILITDIYIDTLLTKSHTFVTSGFTTWGLAVLCWSPWFLPHNVLPNAQNAGSAGTRTRTGVRVHRPNGPQFKMAVRDTSEHTYARNALAKLKTVHVIGLQQLNTEVIDTQANHRMLFGAPRHVRILAYHWLCDGGWTLGMGQWDIPIFLGRDQCLTHVRKRGVRTHTNFTSESAAEICLYGCQACEALRSKWFTAKQWLQYMRITELFLFGGDDPFWYNPNITLCWLHLQFAQLVWKLMAWNVDIIPALNNRWRETNILIPCVCGLQESQVNALHCILTEQLLCLVHICPGRRAVHLSTIFRAVLGAS